MGNVFKKQKSKIIIMPTDFIWVNDIHKYVRMKTFILNKCILIHGFERNFNNNFYKNKKEESDIFLNFIELIENTVFKNDIEVDIFFENTKPIIKKSLKLEDSNNISVVESPNNSRFHEINESFEIFQKKNYNWRFELFESIRIGVRSDVIILFENYMSNIKFYINDNTIYNGLKKIQKLLYRTILLFNSDYPTNEELGWIFDPLATICFISNIYNLSFYKYKISNSNYNVNIKNIIIISKNLDKRIQTLIDLFGGKIDYSHSNNHPTVNVPILKKNNDFFLPYI